MKVEAIVAWVQSARTERSLAGWGKSKGGRCYQGRLLQLQQLRLDRLFTSCDFRGQETDFGKEHAQSKLRGPRSPNLSRTSASFVMEAARKSPSPLSFHGRGSSINQSLAQSANSQPLAFAFKSLESLPANLRAALDFFLFSSAPPSSA
jgi:hypothetical protein